MQITAATPPIPRPAAPARPEKAAEIPDYTGPADGESHFDPKADRWLRPLNKLLVHAALHTHPVQGLENLPKDGAHIIGFRHQGYFDASLVTALSPQDWRFMAAKEQFTGLIGKAMTAEGAFPVDRGAVGTKPLQVANDIMESGKCLALAPEGGIHTDNQIHTFKEGAAMMGLRSTRCESLVPVDIRFQDHPVGLGARLATYGTTAGIVAGGLAAATAAASPILRIASGVVTGTLAGLSTGAALGVARSKKTDFKDKGMDGVAGAGWGALTGAALGGLSGALLGGQAASLIVAAPLSLGAGVTALALGKGLSARQDAWVGVGKPIEVAPYRQNPNHKEARALLTKEFQQSMETVDANLAELANGEAEGLRVQVRVAPGQQRSAGHC